MIALYKRSANLLMPKYLLNATSEITIGIKPINHILRNSFRYKIKIVHFPAYNRAVYLYHSRGIENAIFVPTPGVLSTVI